MKLKTFAMLALIFLALGVVRSAVTTRLDSFTVDEAYHIVAGVSYVRFGDFRMNPEHPPLVKLWVGSVIAATGFHVKPLRQFSDKPDERTYSQGAMFLANDPDSVQRRARTAMYFLNGIFLLALTFALRRVFGGVVALGTLAVLMVDPTVAAHWPVVMTDLPVGLLAATAIVLAIRAFQTWRWGDVAACSAFVGLALTAKHSAPVVLLIVVAAGMCVVIFRPAERSAGTRAVRAGKVAVLAAGALTILWAAYLFRYAETRSGQEAFNRPIADKIEDVNTPGYHAVLSAMYATHVVPRAYLWGFADTVHAGMEGRVSPQMIFGRRYFKKGPHYFFPAIIAVKLPIGTLILIVAGLVLFFARKLPAEWIFPVTFLLVAIGLFLFVLASGATYAGVRHAMPVVVLLMIFPGLAIDYAVRSRSRTIRALVVAAFVAACVSAIPVMRPWEYFNEFAGGTANAYKYFSDEGLDLGQRTKELSTYTRDVLMPAGDLPAIDYWSWPQELKARGVNYRGRDTENDEERALQRLSETRITGTLVTSGGWLQDPFFPKPALLEAQPVKRFGNLFVYQGTFELPGLAAEGLYYYGIRKMYAEKPNKAVAERAWRRAAELEPEAFFINVELGNLSLKRGERDAALEFYKKALAYAPDQRGLRGPIEEQIGMFSRSSAEVIPPLRNPFLE